MSDELISILITQMHVQLNELIVSCNYDLTNEEVLKCSRRLDRLILKYNRLEEKKNSSEPVACEAGQR